MVSPGAVISQLIESITEIGPKFAEVAVRDPISAVLLAFGSLFVFASVAALGGLTLGAVLELLTPSRAARTPPQEVR